jgi:hypothetical protein
MTAVTNLTGKKLNRWKVIRRSGSMGGRAAWLCRCRCGVIRVVVGTSLTGNSSKSCGCLDREKKRQRRGVHNPAYKHGMTNTPTFGCWSSMINRCYNKNNSNYPRWGGRGIRVCPRWLNSFLAFLQDMGERPTGKTLGRKNNNGNYCPGNCEWQDDLQQQRNRGDYNRVIKIDGKGQTIAAWAQESGTSYHLIWGRLERGWSPEKAVFTPPRKV